MKSKCYLMLIDRSMHIHKVSLSLLKLSATVPHGSSNLLAVIGLDEDSKKEKQAELNDLIVEVLRRNKSLHYYQVDLYRHCISLPHLVMPLTHISRKGFHDICTVFLLIFDKKAAVELVEQVTLFFLRYPFGLLRLKHSALIL